MPRIIAIAGGIGSGKSVVSRILREMGCHVYDCDSRAKMLMDESFDIKRRIAAEISEEAITGYGAVDRRVLASVVFADKEKLRRLNDIVHGAVRGDILRWAENLDVDVCWVESAIIYESGIDRMVDEVWSVEAPLELRIERVMARNGMSREEVEARIASQSGNEGIHAVHPATHPVVNDGVEPVLPRVLGLLDSLGCLKR